VVEYANIRTAARTLGVHENTIRKWCDDGTIHGVIRLPGSGFRRVPWSEIERLLKQLRER
jgi:excisionase family DNA binding protein